MMFPLSQHPSRTSRRTKHWPVNEAGYVQLSVRSSHSVTQTFFRSHQGHKHKGIPGLTTFPPLISTLQAFAKEQHIADMEKNPLYLICT